jgi:hypothetical protein
MFWAHTVTSAPSRPATQTSRAVNGGQTPTSAGRRDGSGRSEISFSQYSEAWARVPQSFQFPAM